MIQHIKFEGRPASAAFLDDGFKPVDKAEATIVKVCFTDERGGVVFLTAAPIDDNEVEAVRRKQQWLRAKARAQDTLARVWDESKHPREPSGSSAGGEFAHGGGGDGDSGKTESADRPKPANNYNYGLVPGDAAKFKELKGSWAKINNELLAYVDNPDGPESQARMDKLESIVKEMHGLRADPGGATGIGLPGGPRDVTIVGAGPGGLTASINGAAEGLDTLVIEANVVAGGQARYSSRIENFPGFPVGVTGEKLTQNMFEQAERLGAQVKLGVRVTGMTYDESTGLKHLTLSNGETITSRTVILAGGLEFRRLPFEGSEGPGVIVGDGKALAKAAAGGRVVVVGGSNGAAQAALGCAQSSEHVYLLSRGPITDSMSDYQIEALRANPKVTVIESDSISKLWRDEHGNPEKIQTASGKSLPVKAVGIFVGSAPNTKWLPTTVKTAKGGRIETKPNLETTLPGIYAAGDMREGAIGRVGVAAGEGQLALREANAFLIKQQEEEKAKKKKDKAAKPEKPAKPKVATEKEKAASLELITDLFDLDRDNPWFGQTAENVTPLKTPRHKKTAAEIAALLTKHQWLAARAQARRLLTRARYDDYEQDPKTGLMQGSRPEGGDSDSDGGAKRRRGESDKEFAKRVVDKRPVPKDLPEDHDKYFNKTDNTKVVPVDSIKPSKGAAENKIAGENAAKRMEASAKGEIAKRDPITVRETDDGYVVVDGNGTLTAVKMYDWQTMPVVPEQGRWTETGGDSTAFVSPNVENLDFTTANAGIDSERQQVLRRASADIDKQLGKKPLKADNVIGVWTDGAENSLLIVMPKDWTPAQTRAAMAMKAHLANQKSALLFTPDKAGTSYLASFTMKGNLDDIHGALVKEGVAHHTLQPVWTDAGQGAIVHVHAKDQGTVYKIDKVLQGSDTKVKYTRGNGEFIGTEKEDGTDAEQRADARREYEAIIASPETAAAFSGRDIGKTWGDIRSGWGGELSEKEVAEPYTPAQYKPGVQARGEDAVKARRAEWVAHSTIRNIADIGRAAPIAQEGFVAPARKIADELGIKFKDPGPKTKNGYGRIREKIAEYFGVSARVTDNARGTFIIDHPDQAEEIVSRLARTHEVLADNWRTLQESFYTDRTLLFRDRETGLIGEMQVMDPKMAWAKSSEGGRGHDLYKESRSLPDGPEKDAVDQEMRDLYGGVLDGYKGTPWEVIDGRSKLKL